MDATNRQLRVLGIAGSLRRESYNRRLLAAAAELAPETMRIDPFDLSAIPLYNGDLDNDEARPEPVRALKDAITAADAVLFVTPEYNHTVPGVLQNAIDWASRPGGKSPLAGKPVGMMGASPGAIGSARAQQQLKIVLFSTLSHLMPHAGIVVYMAGEKFDAYGKLTFEPTRKFITAYLQQLDAWTRRMSAPPVS
ncbi:MAG TPA: NAD(P)H-dependent oxidoreductase [Longimicrobiaceae bacterium]|jgi:chromate reductase|nr:NAD(P)H-dependent oxidoreductase [Longimicrobiaceae bacterium]